MREINEESSISLIFLMRNIRFPRFFLMQNIQFPRNFICVERRFLYKKVREHSFVHGLLNYLIFINILRFEAFQIFCLEVLDVC